MFLLSLTLKNARKLGTLAKFLLVVLEPRKNLEKITKKRSSQIQRFSQENVEFLWWSANRDKICQVVRESEKVENRCNRVLMTLSQVNIDLQTRVSYSALHVTTTLFICVINAPACLIHSSTTADYTEYSVWCMGFLGQHVSHPSCSSTTFRAGTLLYIIYTSEFGLPLLPVPCWVSCMLTMPRPDRTVGQLTLQLRFDQ